MYVCSALLNISACIQTILNHFSFQFLQIDEKVDTILSESKPNGLPKGGYGSMLVVHLLRKSRSVHTVRELLGTQFSVVCGRCACLLPFHTSIHEEVFLFAFDFYMLYIM